MKIEVNDEQAFFCLGIKLLFASFLAFWMFGRSLNAENGFHKQKWTFSAIGTFLEILKQNNGQFRRSRRTQNIHMSSWDGVQDDQKHLWCLQLFL